MLVRIGQKHLGDKEIVIGWEQDWSLKYHAELHFLASHRSFAAGHLVWHGMNAKVYRIGDGEGGARGQHRYSLKSQGSSNAVPAIEFDV